MRIGPDDGLHSGDLEELESRVADALRSNGYWLNKSSGAVYDDDGVELFRLIRGEGSIMLDNNPDLEVSVVKILEDLGIAVEVSRYGSYQSPQVEIVFDPERIDEIRNMVVGEISGVYDMNWVDVNTGDDTDLAA